MTKNLASDIDKRVAAIEHLVSLFRWERIAYLVATCLALALLLGAAAAVILRHQTSVEILTPLFGSSGLITYSLGRLLRMWDQALALISEKSVKEGL